MQDDNMPPSIIFEWLNSRKFADLSKTEQGTVEAHFTPSEYESMQQAMHAIQEVSGFDPYKKSLMNEFDRFHHKQDALVKKLNLDWIWKVAAVVLPSILIVALWPRTDSLQTAQTLKTDTVFVDRPVLMQSPSVRETVFVETSKVRPASFASKDQQPVQPMNQAPMDVMSVSEFNTLDQGQSGFSAAQDTLWMEFEAVRL